MSVDLEEAKAEARRSALEPFGRVLRAEAHNLARWPALLWQQCYNELQWEGDAVREVIAPERDRRSASGAVPWLHRQTRLRQEGALLMTLQGHPGPVVTCAVAADGSCIVSAGRDSTLKVWDPSTGVDLRTLRGHRGPIEACAVSPDGAFVVSASGDGTLKLWDPGTGEDLRTLRGHVSRTGQVSTVSGCAFGPDGSYIVSTGADGTLKLWDPATGEELRTLQGHTGPVFGCAVAPDGSYVVSAGEDRTVRFWDPVTGEDLRTLPGRGGPINACAVSPDGAFVVWANEDGTLRLWDPATGEEILTLRGHGGPVEGCAVTPDGAFVVSTSTDGTLKLWDVAVGKEVQTLRGHAGLAWSCAVSPDGAYLVSASEDRTLKLWDLAAMIRDRERRQDREHLPVEDAAGTGVGEPTSAYRQLRLTLASFPTKHVETLGLMPLRGRSQRGHTGGVFGCAVAPDGSYVVSASWDHLLKLWDPATGEELRTLQGHSGPVFGCAVAPDGSYLVSAGGEETLTWGALGVHQGPGTSPSTDRILKLWDPVTGRELKTLWGHDGPVNGCAVSPDGAFVVSASTDGTLKLWDPTLGEEILTLRGHGEPVNGCAVSPDGAFVVSGSADRTLKLWDPADGHELRTLTGHGGLVWSCAVSPDGRFVVSASDDRTLKLWDPADGHELGHLDGHTGAVRGCAVSPDGAYVVSASMDNTLRVWAVESGKTVGLIPLPGNVLCVALHPSGALAACGDSSGTLNLADLVGLDCGPLIVTATRDVAGPLLRCPRCAQRSRVGEDALGKGVDCPGGCGARLRLNPFVLEPRRPHAPARDRFGSVAYSAPSRGENPQRATRLNIEYQRALAEWNALPRLKRLRVRKPERPTGI